MKLQETIDDILLRARAANAEGRAFRISTCPAPNWNEVEYMAMKAIHRDTPPDLEINCNHSHGVSDYWITEKPIVK